MYLRPRDSTPEPLLRARLADQFDAVIHIGETRALEPPERTARLEAGEVAETYPFAE
jgi:hypothetical protein